MSKQVLSEANDIGTDPESRLPSSETDVNWVSAPSDGGMVPLTQGIKT